MVLNEKIHFGTKTDSNGLMQYAVLSRDVFVTVNGKRESTPRHVEAGGALHLGLGESAVIDGKKYQGADRSIYDEMGNKLADIVGGDIKMNSWGRVTGTEGGISSPWLTQSLPDTLFSAFDSGVEYVKENPWTSAAMVVTTAAAFFIPVTGLAGLAIAAEKGSKLASVASFALTAYTFENRFVTVLNTVMLTQGIASSGGDLGKISTSLVLAFAPGAALKGTELVGKMTAPVWVSNMLSMTKTEASVVGFNALREVGVSATLAARGGELFGTAATRTIAFLTSAPVTGTAATIGRLALPFRSGLETLTVAASKSPAVKAIVESSYGEVITKVAAPMIKNYALMEFVAKPLINAYTSGNTPQWANSVVEMYVFMPLVAFGLRPAGAAVGNVASG
ncbi:MAG TPA: hypothetical protein PK362_10080, partial [Elusimicrobiota bacterium]|nr:hypothetical protein [Elusimicrobiota bacterium]